MRKKSAVTGSSKFKCILLIIITIILILNLLYQLSFEKIEFKQVAEGTTNNSYNIYYTNVKCKENLEDLKLNIDNSTNIFDFDNHTYIVTFGYKMEKIKYSPHSKPPHYKDHLNYDCIPKVYLTKSETNSFYIYELEKKVNIDYNMHEISDKVYIRDH